MSGLKDLVYERDYKKLYDENPEIFDTKSKGDAMKAELELLKTVRERFKNMPHVILPESQQNFDFCEGKLDRLALLKQGRIRSTISYVNYCARIDVSFPNGKFGNETLHILQSVTERSVSMNITTTKEGWIKLSFYLDYFENVGDKTAVIHEELDEKSEAVALQNAAYEEERNAVLGMPAIYELVKTLADEVGMTPEAWYDMMNGMIFKNPDEIHSLMEESLKKRRDQLRHECEPEDSML